MNACSISFLRIHSSSAVLSPSGRRRSANTISSVSAFSINFFAREMLVTVSDFQPSRCSHRHTISENRVLSSRTIILPIYYLLLLLVGTTDNGLTSFQYRIHGILQFLFTIQSSVLQQFMQLPQRFIHVEYYP